MKNDTIVCIQCMAKFKVKPVRVSDTKVRFCPYCGKSIAYVVATKDAKKE